VCPFFNCGLKEENFLEDSSKIVFFCLSERMLGTPTESCFMNKPNDFLNNFWISILNGRAILSKHNDSLEVNTTVLSNAQRHAAFLKEFLEKEPY
jgi:hypothetical protein